MSRDQKIEKVGKEMGGGELIKNCILKYCMEIYRLKFMVIVKNVIQ